jgi:cyanophycinase
MALFLVGGGPFEDLSVVYDQFVDAARGLGQRVAVAILGTQDEAAAWLDQYAEPILRRFPEALIEPIWLTDPTDDDDPATEWPADPDQLAGIVVAGGWTSGYLDSLLPQRALLARLVRSGVPYLGFSAGAMVAAKNVILGGWQHRGRQVAPEKSGDGLRELELRDGLGLIGPSVETHTDTYSTLDRAVSALVEGPMSTVIALDEHAALVVDAVTGKTRILGSGKVHWIAKSGDQVTIRSETIQDVGE